MQIRGNGTRTVSIQFNAQEWEALLRWADTEAMANRPDANSPISYSGYVPSVADLITRTLDRQIKTWVR